MSGWVIDASAVIAWLFDDEDEPHADRVLEHIEETGAFVPPLWHLKTRNSLLTAEAWPSLQRPGRRAPGCPEGLTHPNR